jgi:hypothetical protein
MHRDSGGGVRLRVEETELSSRCCLERRQWKAVTQIKLDSNIEGDGIQVTNPIII